MASYIIVSIIAYLIGSINFSILISKKMAGFDVREKGSGNAGSTNVLRSVGKGTAILTLICDALKGAVSVLIAILISKIWKEVDVDVLKYIAGLFAIIGHTFPVFFDFRGGKGVATALGVLLTLNWKIGLICLIFALAIMIITKIVSMGSVGAAILFPVLTLFVHSHYIVSSDGIRYLVYSLIIAALVIFNHRENIKRILNGTENKISFKKEK